jgi:hypothetical protein
MTDYSDKWAKIEPTQEQPAAGNPPIGTVTSSFFVSMDQLFAVSNVGAGPSKGAKNVKDAVQLLWYTSVEERVSQGNMTSDYNASATINHSLVELHILSDSSQPPLRQAMRKGTPIKKMKITRVGHLGDGLDNTELYSTLFEKCFIEAIQEFPDKLVVRVRINTRSDTAAATKFDATETTKSGSTSAGWDYAQNTEKS